MQRRFFRNGSKLGYIKYFIPTAEVETFDNGNGYKLELRASGDVKLEIIMPGGEAAKRYLKRNIGQSLEKCLRIWGFPGNL